MCKQAVIEIEPIANKICRRISKGQLIGRGGECLRIYQPPSLPFIWIGAFDRLFSLNMDFDPDHEKWQFCCCRILTGLKLWAGVEIVLSLILTVVLASTSYSSVKQNVQSTDVIFDIGLLTICALMLASSILLMIGMLAYQEKLMYPTIFIRVILVIFMSAFGVNRFVLSNNNNQTTVKRRRGPFDNEKDEPSTGLRLLFLIFFMLVMSGTVFFSIYLVLRGIRYVAAYKKVQHRRQSLILASQIDPELVEHLRRKSHASGN